MGGAGLYTYYEAYFQEGSDVPFKVVFVSPDPLVSTEGAKQRNTLRFLLENVNDPDKVQFITSQNLADNKTDTQNLGVVKRSVPSPPKLLLATSRVIEVSSSSDEDEDMFWVNGLRVQKKEVDRNVMYINEYCYL